MSIAPYGWRMSSKLFLFVIALIAFSLTFTFSSLIFGDSEFGHRVASYVHDAEKTDQATSYAKDASLSTISRVKGKLPFGSDSFCKRYPDLGNIVVVIKTGATELHAKVPAQLTALRCVSDPLIFSDLDQQLGPFQVHDVLSNVTSAVKAENVDFSFYHLQRKYAASGRMNDIHKLGKLSIASDDWRTEGKSAAWGLDKYKFLHMVERSWELAPHKDWYLFLEADTLLNWPNLLSWLTTLDPRRKSYFGDAIRMYEAPYQQPFSFGHGGAGILLSGTAVRDFAVTHKGLANRWDGRVAKMWFGDYVLAAALHEELKLDIMNTSPSMTEYDPTAVTFDAEILCRPVVTLHHIRPQLLDRLAREPSNGSILVYRDVYHAVFPDGFPSNRTDWDNLIENPSSSLEVKHHNVDENGPSDPHHSFEECERACQQNDQCMQFTFITTSTVSSGGENESSSKCRLSKAFMFGRAREPVSGKDGEGPAMAWQSGWMTERIAAWVNDHQDCHVSPKSWPHA